MLDKVVRFLGVLESRIPTVQEMLDLCDALGIGVRMVEGKPMLRATTTAHGDNHDEAKLLATLFRREPFRTQVIEYLQRKPA